MPRKQKTGIVVSDKMDKSIVVEVTSTKQHPLYKKFIRERKRFMAHDEENKAQNGDLVRIEESRPLSRRKSWVMAEIVRVAPGHGHAIKHTATAVAGKEEEELLEASGATLAGDEETQAEASAEPVDAEQPASEGEPEQEPKPEAGE